jgi:hypothetical protein
MGLLKRTFGHIYKEMVNPNFRAVTHRRYRGFNELNIEGSEIIRNLPHQCCSYRIIRPTLLMLWRCFHVFNASLERDIKMYVFMEP